MKYLVLNKRKLPYMFFIALVCSCIGIFLIQGLLKAGISRQPLHIILLAIGLVASIIAVVCLIAFFRFRTQKSNGERYEKYFVSLGRITLNVIMFLCCFVVISLLFGLLSMLLYRMLRNTLSLDQIKGIINYIISAITIVILPFFMSVFWSEIKSKEGFWKAFVSGIQCNWRKYLKLLVTILILFGLGILVTVLFHYTADNIFFKIVKTVLLSFLGMAGLFITDRICKNFQEERKDENELV